MTRRVAGSSVCVEAESVRNPKPETRNQTKRPTSGRNPIQPCLPTLAPFQAFGLSDFGLRISSFGSRISDFRPSLPLHPSFHFPNAPPPAISPGMSQPRIGIIGGSGLYHIEGFTQQKWVKVKTPFGPPSDEFPHRQAGGARGGVPAPARARPPDPAQRAQSPRQHLGHEEARRGLGHQRQRRRLAPGQIQALRHRAARPVSGPHQAILRPHVLRPRHRRATSPSRTRSARNCGSSC